MPNSLRVQVLDYIKKMPYQNKGIGGISIWKLWDCLVQGLPFNEAGEKGRLREAISDSSE